MVVMGVFRTVCIAWYSLSECACVWERDPKYWQAWLLFGRWDYIWLLFIPLYFSVSSEFFCYWVYITFIIRKKRKVFFPRRKANRAPAKCEDAAENSGWTRTGHRPSEVDGVFEWRRRQCRLYKRHSGSLLSRVSPDGHGVTNKGCSWTLTEM